MSEEVSTAPVRVGTLAVEPSGATAELHIVSSVDLPDSPGIQFTYQGLIGGEENGYTLNYTYTYTTPPESGALLRTFHLPPYLPEHDSSGNLIISKATTVPITVSVTNSGNPSENEKGDVDINKPAIPEPDADDTEGDVTNTLDKPRCVIISSKPNDPSGPESGTNPIYYFILIVAKIVTDYEKILGITTTGHNIRCQRQPRSVPKSPQGHIAAVAIVPSDTNGEFNKAGCNSKWTDFDYNNPTQFGYDNNPSNNVTL